MNMGEIFEGEQQPLSPLSSLWLGKSPAVKIFIERFLGRPSYYSWDSSQSAMLCLREISRRPLWGGGALMVGGSRQRHQFAPSPREAIPLKKKAPTERKQSLSFLKVWGVLQIGPKALRAFVAEIGRGMDWIGLDWGGLKIRRVLDLWWGLEGERGYRTPLCPSIGLSAQNHLLHLVMAPTGRSISSKYYVWKTRKGIQFILSSKKWW